MTDHRARKMSRHCPFFAGIRTIKFPETRNLHITTVRLLFPTPESRYR